MIPEKGYNLKLPTMYIPTNSIVTLIERYSKLSTFTFKQSCYGHPSPYAGNLVISTITLIR